MKVLGNIIIGLVLMLAAVACGSDGVVKQTTRDHSVARPDGPSHDDTENFFRALAKDDASGLAAAEKLTVPGSAAAAYVGYNQQASDAATDSGAPISAEDRASQQFSKTEGGWQVCSTDNSCAKWTDIQAQGSRIATFSVNGTPLDGIIVAGSGQPQDGGQLGSATLLTAYESQQAKGLYITLKVATKSGGVSLGSYSATYRTPEGRQLTASANDTTSIDELGADSTSTILLGFPGAKLGGTLTLPLFSDNGDEADIRVEVKGSK